MEFVHQMLPEEEVYQMLLLFVLGASLGAIARLVRYWVERREA